MKRKTAGIAAMLLLLATSGVVLAGDGAEKAIEGKTFRVENKTIDLGVVRAGKDGVAVFIFRNDTDKDVKIIRAKPT